MKKLMLAVLAAAGLTLPAMDFQDYDSGRDLPADKVWPQGRIFPFAGFQSRNLKKIKEDGFTVAGPGYGANVPKLRQQIKELNFPAFYQIVGIQDGKPVGMKSFNNKEFKPDWQQIEASFAEQIRKADQEYPSILYWYIMPEELRWWKKNEMKYLELFHKAVQENDPKKRPVWMYIPNHYGPSSLRKYLPYLDIIGKGMYVNYSGNMLTRNWARWSSEGQQEAVKKAPGKFAIGLPELFRDPPEEQEGRIGQWVRHDVFMTLACGAKGIVVYSLATRPQLRRTYPKYYAEYSKTAKLLTAPDGPGQIYLFGKICNDVRGEAVGAEQLTAKTGSNTYTSAPVKMTEHLYRGARYLTIINSAEKPVKFRISGIPEHVTVEDYFTKEKVRSRAMELRPLEVRILKLQPQGKKK